MGKRRKKKDWSQDLKVKQQLVHGNCGLDLHHANKALVALQKHSPEWKDLDSAIRHFELATDLYSANMARIISKAELSGKLTTMASYFGGVLLVEHQIAVLDPNNNRFESVLEVSS